jgi:hypothetical protein
MDRTSDGLSIATYIWRLELMYIIGKVRIEFYTQVEGMQGEIFAASPIALQSQCKRVSNECNLMCGLS